MPVGKRAVQRVTWNHFCASRLRAAPDGNPSFRLVIPRVRPPYLRIGFHLRLRRGTFLAPPGKLFLALFEAREIAAARRATVGRRAQAQLDYCPTRRVVVVFAPGGEFLAIAFGAARVSPGGRMPDAGYPASLAAPAAERAGAVNSAKPLAEPSAMRYPGVARAAMGAGKLHSGGTLCVNYKPVYAANSRKIPPTRKKLSAAGRRSSFRLSCPGPRWRIPGATRG